MSPLSIFPLAALGLLAITPAEPRVVTLTIPAAHGGAMVQDASIAQVEDGALATELVEVRTVAPDGRIQTRLTLGPPKVATAKLRTPFTDDAGRHTTIGTFRVVTSARPGIGAAVRAVIPQPIGVEPILMRIRDASGKELMQVSPGRMLPIALHLEVQTDAAVVDLFAWRVALRDRSVSSLQTDVTVSLLTTAGVEIASFQYGHCLPSSIGLPIGGPSATTPLDLRCETFAATHLRPWLASWVSTSFTRTAPDRRAFTLVETNGGPPRRELTSEAILLAYEPPHLKSGAMDAAFESATLAFTGP